MKRICASSLSFKKDTPEEKFGFGSNVVKMLGGGPGLEKINKKLPAAAAPGPYPNLPIPVADLNDVNQRLSIAVTNAKSGAFLDEDVLQNVVTEWDEDFTSTANYITLVAAGNAELIRGAGFVPTKNESQKQPAPGPANDFVAHTNGKKGGIIARAKKKVTAAKGYVFTAVPDGVSVSYSGNTMMFTIGDKTVYITAHTKKNVQICNLPSGVTYNVSMYGFNTAGSGAAAASQQVIPQ